MGDLVRPLRAYRAGRGAAQHVAGDRPGDVAGVLATTTSRTGRERRRLDPGVRSRAAARATPPCTVSVTGAGRSDRVRPVRAGDREPQPVAGIEPVGAGVEDHLDVVLLAGHQRRDAGACTPSRKARSSVPRVISAEVPSGKTSHSFTESEAGGASALTRSRDRAAGRRRVRRARPTPRSASGRRRRAGRRTAPTAGGRRSRSRRRCRRPARRPASRGPSSSRVCGDRAATARVPAPSSPRAGRGPARAASRSGRTRRRRSGARVVVAVPRSQRSHHATISRSRSIRGRGSRSPGRRAPTDRRAAGAGRRPRRSASTVRKVLLR